MSEYRRKTLRSFYCEEDLWKAYEKQAREKDTTIDELLAEALKQFLSGPAPAPTPAATSGVVPAPASRPAAAPSLSTSGSHRAAERQTLERMPAVGGPQAAPPPPPARAPAPPSAPAAPPAAPAAPAAPPAAPAAPAAPPAPAAAASPANMPSLFLHFEGRAYPVAKERFVIGRGSKNTDLTIRDGNVSRKHAVIIFHEGSFYVQDLGSTNGVEFNGQRVDTKIIEEGDRYTICDHELTFSYRG